MKVPQCDLPAQHAPLREGIHAAVDRVLDSCAFNLGEEVLSFEKSFAAALNVKHAIAVSNGSSAVHLALLASGIRPGDEVIVPALTFTATAAAVEWCGASPICADIDDTGCLCPQAFEKAVTKKTRAVYSGCIYMVNRRQWMKLRPSPTRTRLSLLKIRRKRIWRAITVASAAHWAQPPLLVFIRPKIWVLAEKAAPSPPMMMISPKASANCVIGGPSTKGAVLITACMRCKRRFCPKT